MIKQEIRVDLRRINYWLIQRILRNFDEITEQKLLENVIQSKQSMFESNLIISHNRGDKIFTLLWTLSARTFSTLKKVTQCLIKFT